MQARMFVVGATLLLLAACEPEYRRAGTEPASAEPVDEVTGGADPTAISGRVKAPDEPNIQHPNADGNAGRPPDGPGAPAGFRDSTAHRDGV